MIIFHHSKSPLLQNFTLISGACDTWSLFLPLKTMGKCHWVLQPFPCPLSPHHLFICLSFVAVAPAETFSVVYIPVQIQLHMDFGFPNPIPAHSNSVCLSLFLQCDMPLLPPSSFGHFFLCFRFLRSSLIIKISCHYFLTIYMVEKDQSQAWRMWIL